MDLSVLANKQYGIKHPSSKHIIAAYASEFNNRPYNYNDVGEFELHFGASEYRSSPSSTPSRSVEEESHRHHKILIWPEGIELELKADEVPGIYPLISQEQRLTSTNLSSIVKKAVNHPITTEKMVFMIHVTKSQYMERGERVMTWLQEALSDLQQTHHDLRFKAFEFILTLELIQSAGYMTTQIMAMPGNLVLNDALSSKHIAKFVTKHHALFTLPNNQETEQVAREES